MNHYSPFIIDPCLLTISWSTMMNHSIRIACSSLVESKPLVATCAKIRLSDPQRSHVNIYNYLCESPTGSTYTMENPHPKQLLNGSQLSSSDPSSVLFFKESWSTPGARRPPVLCGEKSSERRQTFVIYAAGKAMLALRQPHAKICWPLTPSAQKPVVINI